MFTNLLQSLRTGLFGVTSRRRRAYARGPSLPAWERFERRDLMSATATLAGGVLSVYGTDSADTINVRQGNGIAGSFLSVDGTQIKVGTKTQGSVSVSSVSRIEIYAYGGNDYVSLHVSNYEAVNVPATVWGGTGKDTISGGNGNDTLWGNAGEDWLYGYDGDDFLGAGTAGVDGATVAEKDYLWGGAGFNKFSDGFDFSNWIYQGVSVTDINQQGSPTCVTLATLASAVDAGIGFGDPKITALGNNNFSVKLYNNGKAEYETVNFNGTWSDNDPAPSVDSSGKTNPEFWTILMQRARLEHFYGIDWSKKMTDADWDKASNAHGGKLYDVQTAIKQLHGWTTTYNTTSNVTAQSLADAVNRGDIVVADTPGSGKKIDSGTGLITSHAYAVTNVYKDNKGNWFVQVYNPWGHDTNGAAKDGVNDGYITLKFADFKANFEHVTTGRK